MSLTLDALKKLSRDGKFQTDVHRGRRLARRTTKANEVPVPSTLADNETDESRDEGQLSATVESVESSTTASNNDTCEWAPTVKETAPAADDNPYNPVIMPLDDTGEDYPAPVESAQETIGDPRESFNQQLDSCHIPPDPSDTQTPVEGRNKVGDNHGSNETSVPLSFRDTLTPRDNTAESAHDPTPSADVQAEPSHEELVKNAPSINSTVTSLEEKYEEDEPAAPAPTAADNSIGEQDMGEQKGGAQSDVMLKRPLPTDYEQKVIDELSRAATELPFRELVDRVRQACDLHFPVNLVAASPSPSPRTADTLIRIGYLVTQQTSDDILLVDANPASHVSRYFGMTNRAGLTDILTSQTNSAEVIQTTSREQLSIVPFGTEDDPSLANRPSISQLLTETIQTWQRRFHRVLIDAGQVGSPWLPLLAETSADGILVVPYGKPNEKLLTTASLLLQESGIRVLGCCVTDEPIEAATSI